MKQKEKNLIITAILILVIIISGASIIIFSENQKSNRHDNIIPVAPTSSTNVIAFISDAKPALGKNIDNLVNDLDQIKVQSPGNVSAIVAIGDMNPINTGVSNTEKAYHSSTAKNIPLFYVMGNHEMNNKNDLLFAQSKFKDYSYNPNPGPDGSKETTYSFDINDMHVIVLNEYWDGDTDGICNWNVPSGGLNRDDSCFKYDDGNGGFIPDALFDWLEKDLKSNKKKWTIVVGHEPLYPIKKHVGDSLDEDKNDRDRLEQLFISNKVSAFIGGHTHFANLTKIDGIIHANAGVLGDNKNNGDDFASIIYAYEDKNENLVLEWRYQNPTWINPGLEISSINRK